VVDRQRADLTDQRIAIFARHTDVTHDHFGLDCGEFDQCFGGR
jgi:hypothetical protein